LLSLLTIAWGKLEIEKLIELKIKHISAYVMDMTV